MVANIVRLAHIVILKDGLILLSQRKNTTVYSDYFSLPGGKCKPGESPANTIVREAKEELGIECVVEEIKMEIISDSNEIYKNYYFKPIKYNGSIINNEPDLCYQLNFFSLNALPEPIIPFIAQVLPYLVFHG